MCPQVRQRQYVTMVVRRVASTSSDAHAAQVWPVVALSDIGLKAGRLRRISIGTIRTPGGHDPPALGRAACVRRQPVTNPPRLPAHLVIHHTPPARCRGAHGSPWGMHDQGVCTTAVICRGRLCVEARRWIRARHFTASDTLRVAVPLISERSTSLRKWRTRCTTYTASASQPAGRAHSADSEGSRRDRVASRAWGRMCHGRTWGLASTLSGRSAQVRRSQRTAAVRSAAEASLEKGARHRETRPRRRPVMNSRYLRSRSAGLARVPTRRRRSDAVSTVPQCGPRQTNSRILMPHGCG